MSSSSTPATPTEGNTILKSFMTTLHKFLCSLSDTFDDCEKLKNYKQMFEEGIMNNAFMEKMTIQKWHEAFTAVEGGSSLYVAADNRDMNTILKSKFWFLEEIDFGKKWNDPMITDDDRKSIWLYIDYLNGNSRVYHNVPKKLQSSLEKAASSLGDVNPETLNTMDVSEMLKMTQKLVSSLSEDDIKDLSKNMGTMIEGLGGFEGILNFGQKSGLFGSLFNEETKDAAAPGPAGPGTGKETDTSPLPNIMKGTLESALEFMKSPEAIAAAAASAEEGAPVIPGLTPELENMFASIGSKLVDASGSGDASNPLETILRAMKK